MKTTNYPANSRLMLTLAAIVFLAGTAFSARTIKDELEAARKSKKTVFLVVTGKDSKGDNALRIARDAKKLLKESIVLNCDRDDKSNADLVTKFGLTSAPLPLIMVIGMNGIPAGGLQEKEATAEKLVQMAPSAKKAEAITYINDKKAVFIIGYKKSFPDRDKAVASCRAAVTLLKGNAAYVEVDMDDPLEKTFLSQIGVDTKSASTSTVVFNAQGKNTGSFTGPTDPNKLVTSATTVPKSCCPKPGPGCSK